MNTAHTEIISALEAGKMVILTTSTGIFSINKFMGDTTYSKLSHNGDHSPKKEVTEELLNNAINDVVKFSII